MICGRVYANVKGQIDFADKQKDKTDDLPTKMEDDWLRELVWVMTCQEICRRRQERRNFQRKYYFLNESVS